MKLMIPSTTRSWPYVQTGEDFFLLDASNNLGTQLEISKELLENSRAHGQSWAPANFVLCTTAELAEGAIEFSSTSPILSLGGSKKGSIGLQCPNFLRRDEMKWLKAVLERLAATDYAAVRQAARDGDSDATILVGYFETAYHHTISQRFGESVHRTPWFEKDQFIDAARRCEL